MDLSQYHASPAERERVADLMRLLQPAKDRVLDIGARDGYISLLLTEQFEKVIALDLQRPAIDHDRVVCLAGDVTALDLPDRSVSSVLCAEVLEHIPSRLLEKACTELARVASDAVVIGVPYRQDIRLGRTTCSACGLANAPWGHVNAFDESKLQRLFASLRAAEWSYIGRTRETTNAVSAWMMGLAGNPYGTYDQEESCVHCGRSIGGPKERNLPQKLLTRLAWDLTRIQQRLLPEHPKWVHVKFVRG